MSLSNYQIGHKFSNKIGKSYFFDLYNELVRNKTPPYLDVPA